MWYAEDDGVCPSAHGKWLADVFVDREKKGKCNARIRCEKKGLGHFTYMGQDDRDSGIMTSVLLGMVNKKVEIAKLDT
jgi:hypothetical protein